MGMPKTKKAIKALKERVDTVEMNKDLIERAVGKESAEETIKCKEEIKTLLEAYDRQSEQIKKLNKKVACQKGQLKVFQKKNPNRPEALMLALIDNLEMLEKTGKYKIHLENTVFTERIERPTSLFYKTEKIGSKTVITITEGEQVNKKRNAFGVEIECEDGVKIYESNI